MSHEDVPSRLALAYRAGDRHVLEDLYRALRPAMGRHLARYASSPLLPSALEADDLAQESWVILAELVLRWRPEEGSFLPYFLVSFPWALKGYLRSQSPSRHSRTVSVLSAPHEEVVEAVRHQVGDGPADWDGDLLWEEALVRLGPLQRTAFVLHAIDGQPMSAVARDLGISPQEARRLYRSAVRKLRSAEQGDGADGLDGEVEKMVQALHAMAGPERELPGRRKLCARAGISAWRYREIMELLVAAGCVVDRGPRRTGRLISPSMEETLRRLAFSGGGGSRPRT